ncbi:MAG: O-antigen ligase family protein [Actinobacteria bacterium]|nr:O-antigen ligase family protein [Actinomycetota bacterium]
MVARIDLASRTRLALVGLVAVALGVAAGVDPRIAVAAAIGLAFVVLVIGDLTIGLCLFAVVSFLDVLPNLGGSAFSFSKIVGLLLAISWFAKVSTADDSRNDFLAEHPGFTYVLGVFVAFAALSLTWAESKSAGATPLMRYALNVILFLIVYSAVKTPRDFKWTVGAYVTGAMLAAGYGLVTPPQTVTYYEVSRATGTLGDPNQLAAVLIGGIVLAAALAATVKRSPFLRLMLIGVAIVCTLGIFLTLSRGGLVALGFALVTAVFAAGRWRIQAIAFVVVLGVTALLYFGFAATPDQIARVTSFGNGSGRQDIWTVGWRMVQAHPVRGVGVGNFQTSSIHYLLQPGALQRADLIVDTPKVAHNTYLNVLAEEGVIGAALFVSIILFSLVSILRASRIFERLGDASMELLSRGLLVALAGILAADFFISDEFSKQLWLLLALGPALLAIARSAAAEAERT